jgi:hypothetical protein
MLSEGEPAKQFCAGVMSNSNKTISENGIIFILWDL